MTVILECPNNLDPAKRETAYVYVTDMQTNKRNKLLLKEESESSKKMVGSIRVPDTSALRISYGYGIFEQAREIRIKDSEED